MINGKQIQAKSAAPATVTLKGSTEELFPFPHQVGGFSHKSRPNVLFQMEEFVLKALQPDLRGVRELHFYHSMKEYNALKNFIPQFHGQVQLLFKNHSVYEEATFLKLQDATFGMVRPCVIDIKIGRKTYDHLASTEKKQREVGKYKWQESQGFRVVGMKVFDEQHSSYQFYDKFYGRSLNPEDIPNCLQRFLSASSSPPLLAQKIISQLEALCMVLKSSKNWRMFSTSILIVYDSGYCDDLKLKVLLIDFSHTFNVKDIPSSVVSSESDSDDNFLFGAYSLISAFQTVLENK